ncbi:hypothetical protein [Acidaminococcus massiliensis]|jgi:hypothetical protein|uniref:hypothetical protein n=1 Tax=Acidaminococcus massiliensis TaxID=1852375 RepID=UPI00205A6C1E|nr:hypothetical protein [Acidaminococcus massiliensis]DAR24860.1 MAG TPA: NinB protein [Caudoviricetes sp.]
MKYNLEKIKSAEFTDNEKAIEVTMTISGQNPFREMAQITRYMKDGKRYNVSIERRAKKRSLDANSYAWLLIQKLANVLGMSKEEVYREIIRGWGDFTCIKLPTHCANKFSDQWRAKGLGWIVEKEWDCEGETALLLYPGSSTYNTRQMARFIDAIIDECKEQGIETMTPAELEALKEEWK